MIEVKELTMYYGSTRAVENVSFRVDKGEVLGLLGPNGAGKSTIMKILTTQIVPTSGSVAVAGYDILEQPMEVRRVTGYLPENVPLYADMEVEEYLDFVAKGRELIGSKLCKRLDWVVDTCGIRTVLRKVISQLSKGFRQRVGLAQALIHDPAVLVLDEPTSGLDPLQIIGIRELIRDLASEKTIVVSTHILQEIEAVSDRVIIINDGGIIADGTQESLKESVRDEVGRLLILSDASPRVRETLESVSGVLSVDLVDEREGESAAFRVVSRLGTDPWRELAETIRANGWLVKELREERPSLEEAFIQLTRASRLESESSTTV